MKVMLALKNKTWICENGSLSLRRQNRSCIDASYRVHFKMPTYQR